MPRYQLAHGYSAYRDGQQFGPWAKGDEVELDQVDADWVNRDSPGALSEAKPKPAAKKTSEDDSPARQAKPAADRQHKGGRNRGGGGRW